MLKYMGNMIQTLDEPGLGAKERQERLQAIYAGIQKVFSAARMILSTSYGKWLEKGAEMIDYEQSAAAGIAVERYRRKYGKLPEKLKLLVPEFHRVSGHNINLLKSRPVADLSLIHI